MASSVILKGLPVDVPIHVLAYHLDKFLDTDEIGTFKVKQLAPNSSYQWQVIINFKSSYDAFTAQSILQGFKYKWKDGHEYVLYAKVKNDPSFQSRNMQILATETWGHTSSSLLVPHMSLEDARSCNDMLDAKLELLRKQKLLLQTEREVVEEKRKLEREYRKRNFNISDSEDEDVPTHRSRKEKRAKKSKLRVRCNSGGSGLEYGSNSRGNSSPRRRSFAVLRSVVREISSDHSRSQAVPRSIVRDISHNTSSSSTSPDKSKALAVNKPSAHRRSSRPRSTEDYKAYDRSRDPEYLDSYGRPKFRYSRSSARAGSPESSSYDRPRSLDHSKLYCRSRSPDSMLYGRLGSPDSMSYGRPRSPDSMSYGRPRSPHSTLCGRLRSPDSLSYGRPRSPDYKSYRRPRSPDYKSYGRPRSPDFMLYERRRRHEYYQSHDRSRFCHRRSPDYSRSSRRSRDYDACESPDRFSSGKGRDKGRSYDDNEAGSSKDYNTTTKIIDVTISIRRKKPTKPPAADVTTPDEFTNTETVTNDEIIKNESTQPTNTKDVFIKQEPQYDDDNKAKDFKLQVNIAKCEILMMQRSLVERVTKDCIGACDMKSIMKTLQRILVRRLRFLPLDECMVSDDIVHVYRYMHTDKADGVLITKLIDQLSDPKIEIEDSDNITEPSDADNKLWSIIDQVLEDFKMDCFTDNDDTETVIVGKPKDEIVDKDIFIDETNIKTARTDENVKPNDGNIELIMAKVTEPVSVHESGKKRERKIKIEHCPRNKFNQDTPDGEKRISPHPKFVITVNNVLKAMKPYIRELCGDMNVLRIFDVTTYEIRRKISQLVEGKGYMRSAEITKLYRDRYPKDKDFKFVWKIMENFKNGVYSDLSKMTFSGHVVNDNTANECIDTTQPVTDESDDVIIVENNDVIMLEDDEGDEVEQAQVPCIKVEIDVN